MRVKNGNIYNILLILVAACFLIFHAGNAWAKEYKLSMKDWLFHPDKITINAGDTVLWVNDDDTAHDLVFEDELPGSPKKDDPHIIRIGKKYSLTFEKKGIYKYYCKRHLRFDMVGKIIVKEAEK